MKAVCSLNDVQLLRCYSNFSLGALAGAIKGTVTEGAVFGYLRKYFLIKTFVMDIAAGLLHTLLSFHGCWQEEIVHMKDVAVIGFLEQVCQGAFAPAAVAVNSHYDLVFSLQQTVKAAK